ncbi:hypothetical protein BJ138DRAFT_1138698 [Hygrophoropsis aurantiaca]|uniref:Uncharacterized protein n=1 Tax=Hygrophoropsis aurantiaca TaxID=72124 RepID=A0ACB7ZRD9_9AGAM|nr:hypothetical protein BJ138DRAFT_1138698 [Hygrophoropsis aurantiaca]
MHHIGSIIHIPHLLRRLSTNVAIRLRSLPRSSQVLLRAPPNWEEHRTDVPIPLPLNLNLSKYPVTIIHHLTNLSNPNSERLFPYFTAPWSRRHTWGERLQTTFPNSSMSRTERSKYIKNLKVRLSNLAGDNTTLLIYTDGSRCPFNGHRNSGGRETRSGSWGLGRRAGIYDAEMFALGGSAAAAHDICTHQPTINHVIFLSDN